jgi:hypothetical protein
MSQARHSNTLQAGQRFLTGPTRDLWLVPVTAVWIAALTLLWQGWRPEILVIAAVLLAAAATAAILVFATQVTVDGDLLCVRYFSPRRRCIRLFGLRSVATRPVRFSESPALELLALDGSRLEIRLGTWRKEVELLGIIADAAARSHATLDADASEILRDRPAPRWWARRNAGRPRTAVARTLARLPRPLRWVATLGLWLVALGAIFAGLELATRFSENVLFPRQVDPAWAERFEVADLEGDTWIGNLVVSRDRLLLATREEIQGFWGSIRVRESVDGGATWSAAVPVSGEVDAARHTLVAAPDGSLVAAWSERGPAPSTQRLVTRRSRDGGASWSAPVVVATPVGGLVGLPALEVTDAVRLIAFTDGVTGEIWTQPLTPEGAADGPPTSAGATSRQLYNDAVFADGFLSLTSIGSRVVLSYVDGKRRVHVKVSDDAGHVWRESDLNQPVYGGKPRLATDGATILLAASDPNTGARYVRSPFIRIWLSPDGGATWERGPDVTDVAGLGPLELSRSGGQWRLIYEACPGMLGCATAPRIWYAESSDGRDWSDASILSEPARVAPIGVVATGSGVSAVWARLLADHDWRIQVSRRR